MASQVSFVDKTGSQENPYDPGLINLDKNSIKKRRFLFGYLDLFVFFLIF